jgi:hypothetical protein
LPPAVAASKNKRSEFISKAVAPLGNGLFTIAKKLQM